MIFEDIGNHIELNLFQPDKKFKPVFPMNTSDDVFVDDNGNTLSEALPRIDDGNTAMKGFLHVNETNEIDITNSDLINALTSNGTVEEVPEEEEEKEEQDSEEDPEDKDE